MNNLIQAAKPVLACLRENGFPDAILAGGALRDAICGAPIKDMDFFVSAPSLAEGENLFTAETTYDRLMKLFGESVCLVSTSEYVGSTIAEVYDLNLRDVPYPAQLMVYFGDNDPIMEVGNFDFGLCQVWTDGKDVVGSEAFSFDRAMKCMTLKCCPDYASYVRSLSRFERIRQKYPSYQLVVPVEFQQHKETHDLCASHQP
jgi:hypothetical protein